MFSALRNLWWLTRSCRLTALVLFLLALVEQAFQLAFPVVMGKMVDIISANDPDYMRSQGTTTILLLAGALLGTYILRFFHRHNMVRFIHRTRGSVTSTAFEHLLRLPISFHESRDTGSKSKAIQNGTDKMITLADEWASQGIPVIILYLLSASLLTYYWWAAGVMIGIGVPAVVALSVLFYRLGKKLREERHDCYEEAESLLVEGIQNVATIQSFRMEDSYIRRMRNLWNRVHTAGMAEMSFSDKGYILRNSTILICITTAMWFGVERVASGAMTAGVLIAVFFLIMRMTNELWSLGQIIDQTIHNAPALQRLRELFSIESDIQESPVALRLETCAGEISFEGVSFRYPGTKVNALEDFSLSVKPGSTVALVGSSGAGKSTVFKLGRRFLDPDQGNIRLDGYDLRNLKLDFRKFIAVVSQEVEVFSDTIANNIAAGREDLSGQDIEYFATMAHMNSFVHRLPDGYNTQIGERGLRLSGGQRQRLAIARALAAQCPIILFDEATNALDAESELGIRMAMGNLMGSHTLIIIAHRLSTIRNADKIVVMNEGRVVEQGTHADLKHLKDGMYRRHLQIQSDDQLETA